MVCHLKASREWWAGFRFPSLLGSDSLRRIFASIIAVRTLGAVQAIPPYAAGRGKVADNAGMGGHSVCRGRCR